MKKIYLFAFIGVILLVLSSCYYLYNCIPLLVSHPSNLHAIFRILNVVGLGLIAYTLWQLYRKED